ncbi:MAG: PAS domain S-box protein [candidate division NC10 bacterium]|nr:PAS domain S-box protein [candidate division NC10 bacterium]
MIRFHPLFLSAVTFFVAVAIGGAFINIAERRRSDEHRHVLKEIGAVQAHILERQLDRSLSSTFALASILRQSGRIDNFDTLAAEIIKNYGGISNLQLAPNGVVTQIYPLAGNKAAIGHDLLNDPRRRIEALAAIESRRLTLAGPFTLVQGGVAVIGRLPVFVPGKAGGERFWGFTIALIRLPALLELSNLNRLVEHDYNYQLSRVDPGSGQKTVFAGSIDTDLQDPISLEIEVPKGRWTLAVAPRGGWQSSSSLPFEVGLVFLVSSLVAGFTFSLARRPEILRRLVEFRTKELAEANATLRTEITGRNRAEKTLQEAHGQLEIRVQERTKELAHANAALKAEIAEHRVAEETLRWSKERYRTLIETIPHGIEEIDASGIITVANAAHHRQYEYGEGELIGMSVLDLVVTDSEREKLGNYLTYLVKEQPVPVPYFGKKITKKGRVIGVQVAWEYKRDTQGQVTGFTSVITDITERKQAEEALRRAHDELELRVQERTDALHESREYFRKLVETVKVIPWEADAKTWQFTYVGPQAVTLLGYPIERWYEKDFWATHIHQEDRDFAIDFCQKFSETEENYEFEYRMLSSNGEIFWLHDIVNVIRENGEPRTLRGFMIDITERKRAEEALRASEAGLRRNQQDLQELAGKLLTAQEGERRRLAREMHDDLTQRLAVLAIEAGKLETLLESSGGPVPGKLREMKEQMVKLAADVHAIARQLHPSILDDLGLVDAMESECTSFSQREGIVVKYQPKNVPAALPKDLALCLYRVSQEALRNIAKHAQTTEAHVFLTGKDAGIMLTIEDHGIGFDLAKVRGKKGLGLASMEERARLVQAELRVDSRPGKGTVIEIQAPLRRKRG